MVSFVVVEVYTKAVHSEICARCMTFLKIAGYDLLESSFKDKENDPQQFLETVNKKFTYSIKLSMNKNTAKLHPF